MQFYTNYTNQIHSYNVKLSKVKDQLVTQLLLTNFEYNFFFDDL